MANNTTTVIKGHDDGSVQQLDWLALLVFLRIHTTHFPMAHNPNSSDRLVISVSMMECTRNAIHDMVVGVAMVDSPPPRADSPLVVMLMTVDSPPPLADSPLVVMLVTVDSPLVVMLATVVVDRLPVLA